MKANESGQSSGIGGFKSAAKRIFPAALAVAAVAIVSGASCAEAFDFSGWDALLKKYVSPATRSGIGHNAVAYKKLKEDPQYSKLIGDLAKAAPDDLKSREERLSFWINVYNVLAVKMVADHYPLKSIKDAGNLLSPVWGKPAGVVGGKERTLGEIEHDILRKMGEPRIHTAIVCASLSCPDLRKEAFVPGRLEAQLDDQLKTFLENKGKGMRIDAQEGRVHLSSVFKWFAEDFESRGGVLRFISNYVPPEDRKLLLGGKLKISYLDYDWGLNDL